MSWDMAGKESIVVRESYILNDLECLANFGKWTL